jgi:hypothetical protein
MRDRIIAAVRTAVQNFITLMVASVIAWLASFGIEIVIGPEIVESMSAAATMFLLALAVGVWTWIQNQLEERFPSLSKILSLGLSNTTPEYVK